MGYTSLGIKSKFHLNGMNGGHSESLGISYRKKIIGVCKKTPAVKEPFGYICVKPTVFGTKSLHNFAGFCGQIWLKLEEKSTEMLLGN